MKTMLQIAKEIGVSKQAVFYRIKKPPLSTLLQPFISKNNGVLTFNVDGETLIKQAFNVETIKTFNDKEALNFNTSFDSESNKLLQEQLKTKDTQIEKLIDELAKEREHSREQSDKVISLAEQLAELNKNNQILLKQAQDKATVFISEKIEDEFPTETEKKKGFFKKIFKKSK